MCINVLHSTVQYGLIQRSALSALLDITIFFRSLQCSVMQNFRIHHRTVEPGTMQCLTFI